MECVRRVCVGSDLRGGKLAVRRVSNAECDGVAGASAVLVSGLALVLARHVSTHVLEHQREVALDDACMH